MTMAMAFIGLPNLQLYWSTSDIGPLPALNFGKYMPRWRYMQLKKFMCFKPVTRRHKDQRQVPLLEI